MSGSLGDLSQQFIQDMLLAMCGLCGTSAEAIGQACILYPSCTTAVGMDLRGLTSSLRSIAPKVYDSYPTHMVDRHFFDAPPNPPHAQPDSGCSCVAHGKAILVRGSSFSVVYVGSHNLSKSAWGLKKAQAKSIELGVLLVSRDPELRQQWVQRLPCSLPTTKETWTSARERQYRPATVPTSIRDGMIAAELCSPDEAKYMMNELIMRLKGFLSRPWTWIADDGNFVRIRDIEAAKPDALVDVIGVLQSVGELTKVRLKQTNAEIAVRKVQITDDSGKAVHLTLWGPMADSISEGHVKAVSIVAATNVRVCDYEGRRSLSVPTSSHLVVNMNHARVAELRRWWHTKGSQQSECGADLMGNSHDSSGKVQNGRPAPSESSGCSARNLFEMTVDLTDSDDDDMLSVCL
jgi:hypothetical protein